MTRRLAGLVSGGLIVLALISACAVPGQRSAEDLHPSKLVIDPEQLHDVVSDYREVRSAAVDSLDAKPLSTVETGPVLAVDTGMFEVAEQLDREEFALDGPFRVESEYLPRFTTYPLWFAAVVSDTETGRRQLQIFERVTAADPWLLTATPELGARTQLPAIRQLGGAARRVGADNGEALALAPRAALDDLAAALADSQSPQAQSWAADPFVEQMRDVADKNAGLDGTSFEQSWATDEQVFALRADDGGALVIGTLLREDTFEVEAGLRVTWPQDTPQRAFWPDGVIGRGSLRYYHQVVMRVPPAGTDDVPRTLGTFGGVVGSAGG